MTGRNLLKYILITPARNEAEFIGLTLKSLVTQTVLPVKWVIVSDGSTDGTDEVVKEYADRYPWIELVRMPERKERHFAGKVEAFNAGYARVLGLPYDIIGNLDADISFGHDHFDFLLSKFDENPCLGVAGTAFIEGSKVAYNYNIVNIEHVSGQCQLFRRECFEEIGGYIPIKGGGIDWTAVTTARMRGWKTRTFAERSFVHHRPMGTGGSTRLMSRFRFGKQDYYLGGHPLWEIFRCIYHIKSRPYILGALFLISGYVWAFVSGVERPITQELVEFRRKEQIQRLRALFKKFGHERMQPGTKTKRLQEFIVSETRGKGTMKVLEAGCGSMSHLNYGRKVHVVGIDISAKQLERNSNLDERILGDIQRHHFRPSTFDMIVCWDVLEHVREPERALREFASAVKGDGIILLKMPNVLSVKGLVTKLLPHPLHVAFYKHVHGRKNAGKNDEGPFKTYLSFSIAPFLIKRFADSNGLNVVYYDTLDVSQTNWLKRNKIAYTTYIMMKFIVKIISFGTINDSDFVIVLKKIGDKA